VVEPVVEPRNTWHAYLLAGGTVVGAATAATTILQRNGSLASILLVGIIVAFAAGSRRLPPSIAPYVASAGALLGTALLMSHPVHADEAPFFLVINAAYVGLVAPVPAAVAVALASAAVPVGWNLANRFDSSLLWVAGISLGCVAGTVGQAMLRLLDDLEAAQADLSARAVTDERRRIAREVHDVIAHSLTVTMLHVTGARMALEAGDTDDTRAALLDAEHHGRKSLADIRRTVGLLADADRDATGAATASAEPGAPDIPALVAGYAAAGLDVQLAVQGDLHAVTPAAGLQLYRIVQEGLANAVKHAPGAPAAVEIAVTDRTRVAIRNPAPAPNGHPGDDAHDGHGLRGMQERAALLGAQLRAGRDGHDWLVEVTT